MPTLLSFSGARPSVSEHFYWGGFRFSYSSLFTTVPNDMWERCFVGCGVSLCGQVSASFASSAMARDF